MKQNSINSIKREENVNHLREKILRFKNQVFDKVEAKFVQAEGLVLHIQTLKRQIKLSLQEQLTKAKVLNQSLKSMTLENKSLKSANNLLHIGNNDLNKKIALFEELGFSLMSESQLRTMKEDYLDKLKVVFKDSSTQTGIKNKLSNQEQQTDDDVPKKNQVSDFGTQIDQASELEFKIKQLTTEKSDLLSSLTQKIEEKDRGINLLKEMIESLKQTNNNHQLEKELLLAKNANLESRLGRFR